MLTIRLERDLVDALHEIKTRDGVPLNEQIRRAVQAWIAEKAEAPRPTPRKPRGER